MNDEQMKADAKMLRELAQTEREALRDLPPGMTYDFTADRIKRLQLLADYLDTSPAPAAREVVANAERCYAIYRTRPDENDGKEFFFSALWHNETKADEGERIVAGWFSPAAPTPRPTEQERA